MPNDVPQNTGISGSMIPSGSGLQFGIVDISANYSETLSLEAFTQKQLLSTSLSGKLYVYRQHSHGEDNYLVVYVEDGETTPAAPVPSPDGRLVGLSISQQALPGTGRNETSTDLAKGYFLYRMQTSVQAAAVDATKAGGISWKASSPATVNQTTQTTNQVVTSYSTTASIGVTPDGPSGSVSMSQDVQLWQSASKVISEWNVDENSDTAHNLLVWNYYQTTPWDGRNDVQNFASWWEQAYNMGGGWDDVKNPTNLSMTGLQHCNIAAWQFDGSMVDANGQLNVTFSGANTYYLIAIMMPQCWDNGHHRCVPCTRSSTWSKTIDLVAASRQV